MSPFRQPVVRALVRQLRKRYHALPISERPALDTGALYGATAAECGTLGRYGAWPLAPQIVEFIRRPPAEQRQRPLSRLRRLEAALTRLDELSVVLVSAVAAIREGVSA